MAKRSPLQRATDALQGLPAPFEAMTSLLFLAVANEAGGGQPATTDMPDGADINRTCEAIEAMTPDHLAGALVIPGLEDVKPTAITEAFKYIEAYLASADRARDVFAVAFMEAQAMSAAQAMGSFFSPDAIGQMMSQMLLPEPADWVYEPACGSGSLMLSMIDYATDKYGPEIARSITYIGVELDRRSARLARMNMVLAGAAAQSHIFCGNALTSPIVAANAARGGELWRIAFDLVVANPPFGTKVRSLEPTDPFVIPDRLLNRPVAVARREPGNTREDTQEAA